jgi:hypothetical protein
VRWAIYYGDGSSFTDEDGGPGEAPAFGVAVIVQESERVGRILIESFEGKDYYVFRAGEWFVCDWTGLLDSLAHFPGCFVKFGRTFGDDDWARARTAAAADPRFRPKSARDGRREP